MDSSFEVVPVVASFDFQRAFCEPEPVMVVVVVVPVAEVVLLVREDDGRYEIVDWKSELVPVLDVRLRLTVVSLACHSAFF